jgi:hypothetical protein
VQYDIGKIINLLTDGLDPIQLNALCKDKFPYVSTQFTTLQTKGQQVLLLVDYVTMQRMTEFLLQEVKRINQPAYDAYAPYVTDDSVEPHVSPNLSPNPAPHPLPNVAQKPITESQTVPVSENNVIKEVILVLHGIRDQGEWQEKVRRILEQIPHTKVIGLKYEYLDAIRFWFPFFTRHRRVVELNAQIRQAQTLNRGAEISVIAHSFGTYIITKILKADGVMTLRRLVLCGSIVPRNFDWIRISKQVTEEIVNDCGLHDIWPVMAQSLSWGYGASGTFGFGCASFKDRFHKFGHSGFLTDEFITKFWLPWFRERNKVDGDPPTKRPYLWSWATIPFLQIKVLVILAVFAFLAYHYWPFVESLKLW